GTIVLAKEIHQPLSLIVDGQQRLITLTILLALLRDWMPTLGSVTLDVDTAITSVKDEPRLSPRPADADFFREYVQDMGATRRHPPNWVMTEVGLDDESEAPAVASGDDEDPYVSDPAAGEPMADALDDIDPPQPIDSDEVVIDVPHVGEEPVIQGMPAAHDSQRLFIENRDRLRARLEALAKQKRVNLADLASFILDRCIVVVVAVQRSDEAHRIFSVLNTRGLDLSDADILKSEVLGAITDPGAQRTCGAIWEYAEQELGRDEFQSLLTHIRMIGLKRRPRRAIVDELRDHYKPAEAPVDFVENTVQPMAAILAGLNAAEDAGKEISIQGADSATMERIRRYLIYLGWIPNVSWKPPAIAFFMRYGDNPSAILRFLKMLDRLSFGMLILKSDEGERISRYSRVIEAIEAGQNLFSPKSSAMKLEQRQRQIILNRISNPYFGIQSYCGLVLRRLDAELMVGPLPSYRDSTVEHVLPQNPRLTSQWLDWYPGPPEDPAKGVVENCQRLGNLILLSKTDNNCAANNQLSIKLDCYFGENNTSPFSLKDEVASLRSFDQKVLDRLHERRVRRIRHLWGLL
ncbi:MAG TPA: DUF262 domain-containing protein, partial [Hyphomicrobiaceae bacterium]|nr:DUF262 domain-containing protein [Hyphomicrobiaceae bacterium]